MQNQGITLNLENCLLYLSSTISQFFDFIHCIVFDFIFLCVTVNFIVYFLEVRLFTGKFSWTTTIHLGIFWGRALWADSVSPQMNTIASCDQFRQIRIGENNYLVVNYNGWQCSMAHAANQISAFALVYQQYNSTNVIRNWFSYMYIAMF